MALMASINRLINWLIGIVTLLVLLSGFGISYYQVVTPLTGGVLDKATSFIMHELAVYAFIVLFLVHVYFYSVHPKLRRKRPTG